MARTHSLYEWKAANGTLLSIRRNDREFVYLYKLTPKGTWIVLDNAERECEHLINEVLALAGQVKIAEKK